MTKEKVVTEVIVPKVYIACWNVGETYSNFGSSMLLYSKVAGIIISGDAELKAELLCIVKDINEPAIIVIFGFNLMLKELYFP